MVPGLFQGDNWLSMNVGNTDFAKNRFDVVSRCIKRGINYIDACTHLEIQAYSKALKGRRNQMYLGWSWYENEARRGDRRTPEQLVPTLEAGMKQCQEEYVDLWRITCSVDGRQGPDGKYIMTHTPAESEGIAAALDKAKKSGKARMTGVSSHDRVWFSYMMEKFPNQIDVVVTPYTARSKVLEKDSFFDAVLKCKCGFLESSRSPVPRCSRATVPSEVRTGKRMTVWPVWPSAISSAIRRSPLPIPGMINPSPGG